MCGYEVDMQVAARGNATSRSNNIQDLNMVDFLVLNRESWSLIMISIPNSASDNSSLVDVVIAVFSGIFLMGVILLVVLLVGQVKQDDALEELRREEEALMEEKLPNLYSECSSTSAGRGGPASSEEETPLLVSM